MESENSKAPKTGHANDSDRLLCFAFTSTIASVDSTQMVDMRIEGCATYAAAVAIDRGPVPLDQSRIGISLLSFLPIAIVGGGGQDPLVRHLCTPNWRSLPMVASEILALGVLLIATSGDRDLLVHHLHTPAACSGLEALAGPSLMLWSPCGTL
jgi:hypothetical protein